MSVKAKGFLVLKKGRGFHYGLHYKKAFQNVTLRGKTVDSKGQT